LRDKSLRNFTIVRSSGAGWEQSTNLASGAVHASDTQSLLVQGWSERTFSQLQN
jgi:hypothetical protein